MRRHLSSVPRAFLVGVLFLVLGATLGIAQPKAEMKPAPTAAASPAIVASPGVLIAGIQAGSPAEKAGIARGDIILEVQGTAVNTPADLRRAVRGHKSGDTLSMKVKHGDAINAVTLVIGDQRGRPWIGLVLVPIGRGRGFYGAHQYRGNRWPYGYRGHMGRFPAAGAYVESVVTGGPADKAGLKQDDMILSVDGARLNARHALADMIAAKKVGDAVTLSVRSAGQGRPRDVQVTLEKNPNKDVPYLGIEYAMAPLRFGFGPYGHGMMAGVLVADVTADGPAAKAGIKARDLITKVEGIAVTNPQQVTDAVGKHKPGDSLLITVHSMADGKDTDVTVTLGQNPSDATKGYLGIQMRNIPVPGMPYRGPGGPGFGGMPWMRPQPPAPSASNQGPPTL